MEANDKLKWDDSQEDSVEEIKTPLDGINIINNTGLTPAEMKSILKEQKLAFPGESVEPIVFNSLNKNSRFYVIKSISMSDMERIDKIFEVLQKEQVNKYTYDAKIEFCTKFDIDVDNIPDSQEGPLRSYVDAYLELKATAILQTVNDTSINMVCVVWPPSHIDLVKANKAHMGDVISIALSAQILSGWSAMSNDIDSYVEQLNKTTEEDKLLEDLTSNA